MMSRWVMENVALDLPSSAFGNKKSRKKTSQMHSPGMSKSGEETSQILKKKLKKNSVSIFASFLFDFFCMYLLDFC